MECVKIRGRDLLSAAAITVEFRISRNLGRRPATLLERAEYSDDLCLSTSHSCSSALASVSKQAEQTPQLLSLLINSQEHPPSHAFISVQLHIRHVGSSGNWKARRGIRLYSCLSVLSFESVRKNDNGLFMKLSRAPVSHSACASRSTSVARSSITATSTAVDCFGVFNSTSLSSPCGERLQLREPPRPPIARFRGRVASVAQAR